MAAAIIAAKEIRPWRKLKIIRFDLPTWPVGTRRLVVATSHTAMVVS